jgi:hypothetical protein
MSDDENSNVIPFRRSSATPTDDADLQSVMLEILECATELVKRNQLSGFVMVISEPDGTASYTYPLGRGAGLQNVIGCLECAKSDVVDLIKQRRSASVEE